MATGILRQSHTPSRHDPNLRSTALVHASLSHVHPRNISPPPGFAIRLGPGSRVKNLGKRLNPGDAIISIWERKVGLGLLI